MEARAIRSAWAAIEEWRLTYRSAAASSIETTSYVRHRYEQY